jgi:hypothetical protein
LLRRLLTILGALLLLLLGLLSALGLLLLLLLTILGTLLLLLWGLLSALGLLLLLLLLTILGTLLLLLLGLLSPLGLLLLLLLLWLLTILGTLLLLGLLLLLWLLTILGALLWGLLLRGALVLPATRSIGLTLLIVLLALPVVLGGHGQHRSKEYEDGNRTVYCFEFHLNDFRSELISHVCNQAGGVFAVEHPTVG